MGELTEGMGRQHTAGWDSVGTERNGMGRKRREGYRHRHAALLRYKKWRLTKERSNSMTETQEKNILTIPDEKEGDLRVEWDPNDATQVQVAQESFDRARGRGMTAYRMQPGGGRGEQIREFDPQARAILMAPQMVGG